MGLVEFVKSRLDEEYYLAHKFVYVDGGEWTADGLAGLWWYGDPPKSRSATEPIIQHAARYNPTRVCREIEAKRAILAEHEITDRTPEGWAGVGYGCIVCHEDDGCTAPRGYCTTLRVLGAIWAGHPDYDPAWALPAAADH
jgi:hypothetical protein